MTVPIQQLAEKLETARGAEYHRALVTLRTYIKQLSDTEFAEAIARVDNPGIFRYLYSAGLSYYRQGICAERWQELTK